jgi:hypothetical protein
VNNAFFTWQLTHHAEQSAEKGQAFWPELRPGVVSFFFGEKSEVVTISIYNTESS